MKILACTDLHPAADEAIRQAHAWCGEGDTLAVSHVLPNLQSISVLFPQRNQKNIFDVIAITKQAEIAVRERVASLTGRAADSFEVFLDQGTDYAEITRRAATWKADLVVVGTHGASPIEHFLIGSVTERVARYSSCPVLVTRPTANHGGVVAATDLSDPSLPAIVAGAKEAARRKTSLTVVHAIDFVIPPPVAAGGFFGLMPASYSDEALAEMENAAKTELDAAMTRLHVSGAARVVAGEAEEVIIEEAKRNQAQLIVVGTHGKTGLSHIALGSVAENVMRKAPCSVLVVRLHSAAT
jgi:nucleotide-binding universal stress UspA family protein